MKRNLLHYDAPVLAAFARRPDVDVTFYYAPSSRYAYRSVNVQPPPGLRAHRLFTVAPWDWWLGSRALYLPWCPALPWHLWRGCYDVVLYEGASNFLNLLWCLPGFLWSRSAAVVRTLAPSGRTPGRLRALVRRFNRFLCRRADSIILYNSHDVAYYLSIGVPRERLYVAVNALDDEALQQDLEQHGAQAAALRTTLGIGPADPVVLFVGSLLPGKRVDTLLAAFTAVAATLDGAHLVIVGDGPCRDDLVAAVAPHLDSRIHFVGAKRSGISAYFKMADLFVLPGLGGLAIYQAMYYSLPVICTVADGTEHDYIENGVSGLILDDDSAPSLAAAMLDLLRDPERRQRMGHLARERIITHYRLSAMLEVWVQALRDAVARRRRQATCHVSHRPSPTD